MSNLLDTVMNIEVFAFIGLLLWLYFKQFKTDETENSDAEQRPMPRPEAETLRRSCPTTAQS